jgi:hypothetical protein
MAQTLLFHGATEKIPENVFHGQDQWGREKGGIIMEEFFVIHDTTGSLFLILYGVLLFLLNILVFRIIALY